MSVTRRLARHAKTHGERRYTINDTGWAILSQLVAAGMPIPKTVDPAALSVVLLTAIAIAHGESVPAPPESPAYPTIAWLNTHPDELGALRQTFQKARGLGR